jgi:hypothetical protein
MRWPLDPEARSPSSSVDLSALVFHVEHFVLASMYVSLRTYVVCKSMCRRVQMRTGGLSWLAASHPGL